jgi:hypothetical protein
VKNSRNEIAAFCKLYGVDDFYTTFDGLLGEPPGSKKAAKMRPYALLFAYHYFKGEAARKRKRRQN